MAYTIRHLSLQETKKMWLVPDNRDDDSPADHGVLPPPETVESGSIREALPSTGDLSAGKANNEVAPNGGAGLVPAAEISFPPLANLLPIPDEA
jgi:hypothetical protein